MRRWWGLAAMGVAVSMVIVDVTVINVAVPAIVTDLRIDDRTTLWVQATYTLTLSALLLLSGRLGDRIGRRRLLLWGVAVFVLASVVAALAATGWVLVLGRLLQGVGGAAILPATLSLINAQFRGRARATAFAVWGSLIGGVSAIGPVLGGWLTDSYSWRWAFGINLVLGAVALAGCRAFITESRPTTTRRGLDVVGIVLAAAAPALVVLGLVEGRSQGWLAAAPGASYRFGPVSVTPVLVGTGLLAGLGLVWWLRSRGRRGSPALLDLRLFGIRRFARGNLVVLLVALGQLGLLFVLPLWLQNVTGRGPVAVGLLLLPVAAGAFAAAAVTPALATRLDVTTILRIGLVVEVIALLTLGLTLDPLVSLWVLVPALAAYGFGVGTADAQLPGIILADVPTAQSGEASGIQGTAQELGSALGVAVLGTVLLVVTAASLGRTADPAEVELVTTSVGTVIPGLTDPDARRLAQDAFTDGTSAAALTGASLLTLGLFATASLRRRPERTPQGILVP